MARGNVKTRPSRSELYDLYVTQELSQREVAEHVGVTYVTIRRWLADAGIRSRGQGQKGGEPDPPPRTLEPKYSRRWFDEASPQNQERARLAARELYTRRMLLLAQNRSPQSIFAE